MLRLSCCFLPQWKFWLCAWF